TREVALAVMATTLSLVVIFLPVAFMTGYARRFINPFGWTMAFSIMVSMLVSFTLTPMLSSRFLKLSDAVADHKTKERGFFHWLDRWYSAWVVWSLDHSGVIIAISVVVFLLTFPLNRMVGREFVPNEDMGEWTIHVDTPEGTSLEGSSEVAKRLVAELSDVKGIAQLEPMITERPTHIHLQGQALPYDERNVTSDQIITELRHRLAAHPAMKPSITVRNPPARGEAGHGFPINANLLGPDLERIAEYSLKALEKMQQIPSLADQKISLNISNPEIHVAVDRSEERRVGKESRRD